MPTRTVKAKRKIQDPSFRIAAHVFASFLLFIFSFVLLQKPLVENFCANSESCISDLSGTKETNKTGVFMGKKVVAPEIQDKPLYALAQTQAVLGETTADYKRIYVDLARQRLYAYEGNTMVYNFPVSTGKWNKTPTGDFRIWIWLRYTRMSGGSQAAGTYYNLPNVPYTMFYYNEKTPKSWGYSLHGAYWHDNFGHPMSHGCVNMKPEDAGKIFYWTHSNPGNTSYANANNPGTLITVYGTAPNE